MMFLGHVLLFSVELLIMQKYRNNYDTGRKS